MIQRLSGTSIWSEDLNRLLPFYRDLLGLPVRVQTPGFVLLGAEGSPALGIGTHSEVHGKNADPARHMVGFDTDDVDAEWKRLTAAGVKSIEKPTDYGRLRIATFADPEGNLVQLYQPRPSKIEDYATRLEAKTREARTYIGALSDADWKKTTAAEGWSVGVTAHHLAGAVEPIAGLVASVAAQKTPGDFTTKMLDQMNAQHATEHARCTREETLALLEKGAASALATLRGIPDERLETRGTVFADQPPMSVEDLIVGGLIGHIDDHLGSIRAAVGR